MRFSGCLGSLRDKTIFMSESGEGYAPENRESPDEENAELVNGNMRMFDTALVTGLDRQQVSWRPVEQPKEREEMATRVDVHVDVRTGEIYQFSSGVNYERTDKEKSDLGESVAVIAMTVKRSTVSGSSMPGRSTEPWVARYRLSRIHANRSLTDHAQRVLEQSAHRWNQEGKREIHT